LRHILVIRHPYATMASSSFPSSATKGKRNINLTAQQLALQPIHFNPVSEWEEIIEVPGLTLFDIHRRPRPINNDSSVRVKIPLKVLNAEFHCPVCLGYMKKTMIVMECLHRFCGQCIQKCLRLGKKECPSCRIHIPSRRSLRPDPNFDELIGQIYGDIDAVEQQDEKEIAKLNRAKNMNNAYAECRRRGIMQQAMHRRKRSTSSKSKLLASGLARKSNAANGTAVAEDTAKTTQTKGGVLNNQPVAPGRSSIPKGQSFISKLEDPLTVNCVLRRHPQERMVDRLDREYIRTSGELTMHHLKIFLSRKLSFEPPERFQILTITGETSVIVYEDKISLYDIKKSMADAEEETILHFRIAPTA